MSSELWDGWGRRAGSSPLTLALSLGEREHRRLIGCYCMLGCTQKGPPLPQPSPPLAWRRGGGPAESGEMGAWGGNRDGRARNEEDFT